MTKSNMVWRFENDYSDQHFCHFYVAQNIKYLKLIFYMFIGYIIDYMIFLLEKI
jgi:hypothetical protein